MNAVASWTGAITTWISLLWMIVLVNDVSRKAELISLVVIRKGARVSPLRFTFLLMILQVVSALIQNIVHFSIWGLVWVISLAVIYFGIFRFVSWVVKGRMSIQIVTALVVLPSGAIVSRFEPVSWREFKRRYPHAR